MRLIFFIFFLLSLAISSNANSQTENGKIIGRILDVQSESGHDKVTITLFDGEGNLPKFSTRSNSGGNFSFMNIPEGEYIIKIQKSGFSEIKKSVLINPHFTLKMEVKIKNIAISEKESISEYSKSKPSNSIANSVANNSSGNVAKLQNSKAELLNPLVENQIIKGDSEVKAEIIETKEIETPQLVEFPDEIPSPIGGISAIIKNIDYPEIAKRMGVDGIVVLSVLVNQNGEPEEISILKSAGTVLDEAAIRTIYKTKFNSGVLSGKTVISRVSIPVKFQLK